MTQQHVTPKEAVVIHTEIGSKASVGMHWGTFELADEPFLEPPTLLAAEVEAAGLPAGAFNVRPMGRVESVSA